VQLQGFLWLAKFANLLILYTSGSCYDVQTSNAASADLVDFELAVTRHKLSTASASDKATSQSSEKQSSDSKALMPPTISSANFVGKSKRKRLKVCKGLWDLLLLDTNENVINIS
jgi:hypothetical protein